ncbi:MAG: hypothetical protein JNM56_15060 [Planctomycetia bacterium]|nr:hypothetical protein [Planctomycetia bacterium]
MTGPGGGAKPGNLPSTGGSIGGPNGGVVGGGKGPTTLPATGGGSIVGGGKVGPGLPNGPGTGPGTPGRPGTPGVGPGTPGRLPGDGGLGAIAKTNPLAPKAGTLPVNRQTLNNRGVVVRNNFNHYDCFHGNWWGRYPGAWRAARWGTAAVVWGTASWAACSSYCGYPAEPVYYDYGSTVVYQGDSVYVNGDAVATQEQYAQQATTIADTGKQAQASKDEDWLPLGVFGMVQGEQTSANDLFQLAVNKAGVIRGNYYNALSDATLPVYGSVDKKSQRAAWTVGDKKEPIYEAGFANLTKAETTMLVHFGKDRTQQWTLVRIEQPPEQKK